MFPTMFVCVISYKAYPGVPGRRGQIEMSADNVRKTPAPTSHRTLTAHAAVSSPSAGRPDARKVERLAVANADAKTGVGGRGHLVPSLVHLDGPTRDPGSQTHKSQRTLISGPPNLTPLTLLATR